MPITKSAKKALRQSLRRKRLNLVKKEAYKNAIRKIKKLLSEKKISEARVLVPKLYQALDKATKANVIKKNKASRLKSRTSRLLRG